jgi:hypothetical protein
MLFNLKDKNNPLNLYYKIGEKYWAAVFGLLIYYY